MRPSLEELRLLGFTADRAVAFLGLLADFRSRQEDRKPFEVGKYVKVRASAWSRFWGMYGSEVPHPGPQLVVQVSGKGVKLPYPSVWWPRGDLIHTDDPEKDITKATARDAMGGLMAQLRKVADGDES